MRGHNYPATPLAEGPPNIFEEFLFGRKGTSIAPLAGRRAERAKNLLTFPISRCWIGMSVAPSAKS
jgi:hypothetical protein